MKEDWKGIGQPTYKKVSEELFLDKPLHVILNNNKLAYRIYVILIANKQLKKKERNGERKLMDASRSTSHSQQEKKLALRFI
jgi:hypothetical protein